MKKRTSVKIVAILIVFPLLLSNSAARPQETKTWSPTSGESTRAANFQSLDGTGLFLETLEVEKDKGLGVGIMPTQLNKITEKWHSRYFLVLILSNMGLPGEEDTWLEGTALDKTATVLYPVHNVSNEIPKVLRPGSRHRTGDGFEATYAFFPNDTDAMHITVVLHLGNTTFRFPFARSPENMWFSGPHTPTSSKAEATDERTGLLAGGVVAQSGAPRKDIPSIARSANGSIVSIVMSDKSGQPVAQGSGFLVSKDGLIVTNYHVIAEGSSAIVKLPDGAFYVVDGVLASDKTRDIAIVKAQGQKFRTLPLGDSDEVQVGEGVVAIGNPLSLESTVSNGIISGIREVKDEGGKYLQITAPISPGSSGGPLFNMAGEVIGITTLYLKGGENLNFAIPINEAKRLLRETASKLQDFPNEGAPLNRQTHDSYGSAQEANPNEGLIPPEVVRSEEMQIDGGIKRITVSNTNNRYHLICNATTDSCRTPVPDKDYLVFSMATRWRMPGAKEPLTLKFLQDFSVIYNGQDNIALVPSDPDEFNSFGIYVLLAAVSAVPQSARDYFNELKATNAFKSYRDEYVCFDDGSSEPSFAVVARATDAVRMMKKAGATANAHKLEQSEFKDSLFVQMYYKGVGSGEQIYNASGTEGTDFVIVFSSPIKGKMTYSINWATGRYRRAVYALDQSRTLPALEFSGKCELIHADVPVPRR